MAIPLNKPSFKEVLKLLNTDNIVNRYYEKRYDNKNQNIFQLKKENNKYYLIGFNVYGMKQETKELDKRELKYYFEHPERYENRSYSSQHWSYHKKKVSRKSVNKNIIDEEEAKKSVYKWLLKKYKKSIIVPEFSIGDRRADYICFTDYKQKKNDTIIVEIKSEVDNFNRLEDQLKAYQTFGTFIYIAIHSNKIKKLEKYDIPDNVGIIEINNKNLSFIKEATYNNVGDSVYADYVSYLEYKDAIKGLKFNSKIDKDQIFPFLRENFTDSQLHHFYHKVIRRRYEEEHNKRLQLHKERKYTLSVSSAKRIGIDRMNIKGVYNIRLLDFFNIDKNLLFDYYNGIKSSFEDIFKDKPLYLNINKDYMKMHYLSSQMNINTFGNDLQFMLSMIEHKDILIKSYDKLLKEFLRLRYDILRDISKNKHKEKDKIIIEVYSQEEIKEMSLLLEDKNLKYHLINYKDNWMSKINEEIDQYKQYKIYLLYSESANYWHREPYKVYKLFEQKR